ncbi:YhgE/Pip domain-containing protein [Actinomyces sp.]|uniref:YhgE/Pip domain-containing protein n=1 Tax=Actinomyces sp. TaxID=29317 RepID=UPI002908FFF7|nr:YhgE/Pip domain-containing protein [Actinomyces sp.]MDU5568016.1 YhgE/Pip domain-containing protein [Actinomyces sp.]
MKLTGRDIRALVAVVLLPILATALTLWSLPDRPNNFNKIPAAIVNLDEGAKMVVDGEEVMVPIGRELAGGLMYPEEPVDLNLDWQLVTEETARSGLESGQYQAVITIPKNFSKNVTSIGTTAATPALITVTSNDASSELMGRISAQIAAVAATTMGHTLTETMLDEIFLGFGDMKDQLGQAADGAKQLDDGVNKLGEGAGQLSSGARELADGTAQLAAGLNQLYGGANELAGGVSELRAGVGQLADGADQLASGTKQLRDGFVGTSATPGLKSGIDQLERSVNEPGGLAEGTRQLADGSKELSEGIDQLVDGLNQVLEPLARIEESIPDGAFDNLPSSAEITAEVEKIRNVIKDSQNLLDYVRGLVYGTDQNIGALPRLKQLAAQCDATQPPQYCAALTQTVSDLEQALANIPQNDPNLDEALAQLNELLTQSGINELVDQIVQVSARIEELVKQLQDARGFAGISTDLERLREGSSQLAAGIAQLRDGVNGTPSSLGMSQALSQLSTGAAKLQAGLDGTPGQLGLVDGARQLAAGLRLLNPGLIQLEDGTWQLAQGAGQSSSGASQLAGGTDQLAGGTSELYAGIGQLIEGTSRFATELEGGVDQVPSYTDAERTRIVNVGAIPIRSENAALYKTSEANTLFPWAAAIVLWLGAFATYLAMPGLRRRELASSLAPVRVAWNSLRPALVFALVQVVGVAIIAGLFGVSPKNIALTSIMMVAGVVSFTAINQALLAVFGARVGRILALLFLVVQVVSLGGLIPIQTAPSAFQMISGLLPLSALMNGLTHTVVGGNLTSIVATAIPLLLWGLVSFLFSAIAARKARRLDVAQLRRQYAEA